MIEEKNEMLWIQTELTQGELIGRLSQVRLEGGRRHKINFSNGLVLLQTEMEKRAKVDKEWAQYGARNDKKPT